MRRILKKFFHDRKKTKITLEEIKMIFKYINKQDRIDIKVNDKIITITHGAVVLRTRDIVNARVIMRKQRQHIIVVKDTLLFINRILKNETVIWKSFSRPGCLPVYISKHLLTKNTDIGET